MAQDNTLDFGKGVDIKSYLHIIYHRRYILILVMVAIMVGDIAYTFFQKPIYKATALVLIEKTKTGAKQSVKEEAVTSDMSDIQYYMTQYEILKSRSLADRVVKELTLGSIKDFQDDKLSPAEILQKMIDIEPIKSSRLVRVSIEYKNPELAMKMANALARSYVAQNTENMLYMSKEILKMFSGGSNVAGQVVIPGGIDNVSKEDIMSLLPSLVNNKVLEDLKAQEMTAEADLGDLSKRYKEKHPMIIELNNKISQLKEQIKIETDKALSSARAGLSGILQANNIRVFDYASIPKDPFKPNKLFNILMGLAVSLGAGIASVFAMEFLDSTVKTEEDVKKYLDIPYMGRVPVLSKAESQDLAVISKNFDVLGAIKSIKTNIVFSDPKGHPKTILITSTVPEEGKTSIATFLAYSFSKSGVKTLLIDADMYKSRHHDIFNLGDTAPGLSDILMKDIPLDKITRKTSYDNLYVLTAGSPTSQTLELLSSERAKYILDELSKKFDNIIIDTPPSFVMSDAIVLSRICDMVVFVIKSGVVDWKTLVEIKEKFTTVGVKINGVIINYLDAIKDTYYNYKYSEYCKHYYSALKEDNGKAVQKEGGKDAESKTTE